MKGERARLPIDFSRVNALLDQIADDANSELDHLLAISLSQMPRSFERNLKSGKTPTLYVPYEIRLGSTRIPLSALNSLSLGSIVSLQDSQTGFVQVWLNNQPFGQGKLIVVDGKLAVRLESLVNSTKRD